MACSFRPYYFPKCFLINQKPTIYIIKTGNQYQTRQIQLQLRFLTKTDFVSLDDYHRLSVMEINPERIVFPADSITEITSCKK